MHGSCTLMLRGGVATEMDGSVSRTTAVLDSPVQRLHMFRYRPLCQINPSPFLIFYATPLYRQTSLRESTQTAGRLRLGRSHT